MTGIDEEKQKEIEKKKKFDDQITRMSALKLLRSPNFLNRFRDAVAESGLVGEKDNALAIYLAGTSRLLERPINIFVKGDSSTGKNFITNSVLRFFPPDSVVDITSSSGTSWNYQGDSLQHKIVYIQEHNKATGNVHPARLLISEKEIVRMVAVREGRSFRTVKQVTKGPISCISTTTREKLEIDDETRNISLFTDSSPEQSRRIITAQVRPAVGLPREDTEAFIHVQHLLAERTKYPIVLGDWAEKVIDQVFVNDVRIRRYFPALLTASRAVCLIRSYNYTDEQIDRKGHLTVRFTDLAIAIAILDRAFSQSLSHTNDDDRKLREAVRTIALRNKGGARAEDLANDLNISRDQAYRLLRDGVERGVVVRLNQPAARNVKLYGPTKPVHIIPDMRALCRKIYPGKMMTFIHPLTGALITLGGEEKK